MTERIYMGDKNGRMGFWVSAPGYDASAEVGKWLANSDYDQLKLIHQGTAEISADPGVIHTEQTVATWTNLGYAPLVFLSIRGSGYTKHFYPFNGALWRDSGTETFGYSCWFVYSDHLTVALQHDYNTSSSKWDISYHVFANDLPVTVL